MDLKRLKIELTQGKLHADELKELLKCPKSLSSREASGFFLEKVIDSYDNALALINDVIVSSSLESPNSVEDNSFKDRQVRASKKRKTQPAKWREQVSVCSETVSDGYNWRKYGQKKILKANHPRAYYRCTHRHTQGCLATKQVQREEDNPSDFTVVYIGKHTCIQETLKNNLQGDGRIDDDKAKEYIKFPSFSFHAVAPNDGLVGADCSHPPFETSESYFSTSHCQLDDEFSISLLHGSESDFAEIVSNPTIRAEESLVFGDIDTQFLDASDIFW